MKKTISLVLTFILIASLLVGCGGTALELNTANVAKIALTANGGGSIVFDKTEDVSAILLALQNANCSTSGTSADKLPTEQYRFTTYNAENTQLTTYILYSEEYLQVDTVLYKGTLSDLQLTLDNYTKADSIENLSQVFTAKADEFTELAFYNHTKKTFKVITGKEDIKTVLSTLQGLKSASKEVTGEITEEYTLYFRLKNSNEYLPGIEIKRHETGTSLHVGIKCVEVTNYNWNVLYEKLEYNKMKIQ